MADWGARDPAWKGVDDLELWVRGHPVSAVRHPATGDGPPQLLVHGLGGSARNWLDVMPALAAHGEVVAIDLPGFGATAVPAGGSARVRANAGFVVALLEELGWRDATVVGNSMGGLIVTAAAARRPDLVGRLVLVNPALPAPRKHMFRVSRRVAARILPAAIPGVGRVLVELGMRAKTPEELVDESLAGTLADAALVRPTMREVLVENAADAATNVWRRRAIAEAAGSLVAMIAEGRELTAAVDAIVAPTLLLWGDADRLVSTHVIAGLVERRPDWEQHVFGGVGHAPMLEDPEAFVEVVSGWYGRVAGGSPAGA